MRCPEGAQAPIRHAAGTTQERRLVKITRLASEMA